MRKVHRSEVEGTRRRGRWKGGVKGTLMPWGLNMQKGARYAKGRATGVMLFTVMICYIGLKQDI